MASTPIFLCLQFLCLAFLTIIIQTRADDTLGKWDLLVQNAGIASMHTAVTRYSTVILLDRTDIGPSNLSLLNNQCRDDPNDQASTHDCTAHSAVLNLKDNTIRPLEILTDTWCSSGQFLPNGTLLQTGGYNDGAQTIRMFSPCNVNSQNCDWYEFPNTTSLYQGRWYATNQILPDGSVIIIGGMYGNTLEYFPPRGNGAVDFPFLGQSADDQGDNLYPYVHLLPNGYLFIFDDTQSMLYNYTANAVVTTFPQLVGGPRNYPSTGSSVMLALEGNNNYMATIVICGGAQYNAYKNGNVNATAQSSCGRIVATDANPDWEMEDMPNPRCMGDMVVLPSGEVVIINGAQAGSQGWGGATNPSLAPVLYQPDLPVGSRFTTLNPTTIPRVYHSTANLLPDGRILIAGSNTHQFYTWNGLFPTELRIEAFSPGYLAEAKTYLRLEVVNAPETVGYGKAYNVYVNMSLSGEALNGMVEVNFVSAPFATHSFSQGQRLVKCDINRAPKNVADDQYEIVFTTPPNSTVAPPGYYMMFVVNLGVPSIARWVQLVITA